MKILIAILFVLIVYFVWRFAFRGAPLVLVVPDSEKQVTGVIKHVVSDKEIVIEIDNNSQKNYITEISFTRSLAADFGLLPPLGFKEESLSLNEKEKKDKGAVDFVENFNKENVRWIGNFSLAPNTKTNLIIPAKNTKQLIGQLDFRYEAKRGFGGFVSSFRVTLVDPDLQE